jgi:hypothetical protein
MNYPKSLYRMTSDMEEKHAFSHEEECTMVKLGWHRHPEEARMSPHLPAPVEAPHAGMTKEELEAYGRSVGVELDRRKSKANMLKDLGL